MRFLEWLIALVILVALVSACLISAPPLAGASPFLMRALLLLLIPLVCAHVFFEGMHWQMIPIYLAGLFLIPFSGHAASAGRMHIALILTGGVLFLAGISASFAVPMFKLMKPTGNYPIGTRTLFMTDASREEMHPGAPPGRREIVVQIWYPSATSRGPRGRYRPANEVRLLSTYHAVLRTLSIQDAPVAPGPFPVLIFNHAWGGFRSRSTFLAQELASHGFVVAAISHPYNANITTLRNGHRAQPMHQVDIGFYAPTFVTVEDRLRIADQELRIQVDDCIFVLDELATCNNSSGDPLYQHLRLDRVGTFGHSYGGATSVELALEDARVQSVLALDGVLHGRTLRCGVNKPVMMIDSSWLATPHGNVEDSDPIRRETAQLWALMHKAKKNCLATSGGWELVIEGTNHENFTDMAFMSPLRKISNAGPLPQRKAAAIISAYTVAFFRQTLLGEKGKLLSSGSDLFSEVTFKLWPGPALNTST